MSSKSNLLPTLPLLALVVAGCQTASLENAAPEGALAVSPVVAAEATTSQQPAENTPSRPVPVPGKKPELASIAPNEQSAPAGNKEFVTNGARRTGVFPNFGRERKAANTQLTEAERLAAEAEIAELLRARASTPGARARYEARLRRLRALAANHASDTRQEIEN